MKAVHTISVPTRPAEPGVALEMLVLADGPGGCATVDISSGALVRAIYPGRPDHQLQPFERVRGVLAEDPDGPDPTQPEAVLLTDPPEPRGRVRARQVRRLLAPLLLPADAEPLGFAGPGLRYWMVPGDRPSLALLRPQDAPVVGRGPNGGPVCRFLWRRSQLELPLTDRLARRALAQAGPGQLSGRLLTQALGYEPSYLLLALTPPLKGHCYKVVAGLVPKA